MKQEKRVKRLSNSLVLLNKAEDKKKVKSMERLWIQDTKKIHAFNYWYYRYLTNEFELYILDAIQFIETDKEQPIQDS